MKEHLNSYCKGCDQFSAPHRRRDDGQWVCEDCGHLVECSDPQWSDNCDGDLTTPYEVKKGLCEGCMAVIDSWSEDGDADDGPEQAKLVTDGGENTEHDIDYTGDDAEERLVLCVPCRQYQPLTREGHPECEHSISDAKDISQLDGLTWAYIRLHAYRQELERDKTRGSEAVIQSNIMSLVSDLAFSGEDVPEPDEMATVIERRVEA